MRFLRILTAVGMLSFSIAIISYISYYYLSSDFPSPPEASPRPSRDSEEPALAARLESIRQSAPEGLSATTSGRRIYIDIADRLLFFDSDSYTIRSGLSSTLRILLEQLGRFNHLLVSGHADSSGDSIHNYDLSRRRAEAVASALVALGVDSEDITSQGFGEMEPAASNNTEQGRSENRRVQIEAIYGSRPEPEVRIVEVRVDACTGISTWQERLACSLKNNTWILLIVFVSALVTLLLGSLQLGGSLMRKKT